MKESAFQLITMSPKDKELDEVLRHARHTLEKRQRFISFLFLKMMGRF